MGKRLQAMSVNTRRKGIIRYPITSEGFVFLANGHACPYLNIRSRCIPLVGARHCRSTYDACQRRWGILWRWYVTLGWTTRETYVDIDHFFDEMFSHFKADLDKKLDQPYHRT